MFHQTQQNFRQRAARFARGHQVHVKRWKNPGKIAQRLRKTPALDQPLMQPPRQLLHARLLETLFQNGQSLIERHSRLQQMSKLLGKNEQLAVWNF